MRLLLIGPIDGSKGGVNIHLNRLKLIMQKEYEINAIDESNNKDSKYFNIRSKNIFKYIKILLKTDIVHIHTNQWWLRTFHIFFSKLLHKKVYVTIHSYENTAPQYQKKLTNLFLLFANKVIIVSPELKSVIKHKNINIIPAFIPPDMKKEPELPIEVLKILDPNYKIISTNASQLYYLDNVELYGFDLCIELALWFKEKKLKNRIIFVVAKSNKLLEKYKEKLSNLEIEEHFILIDKSISFSRLIDKSDAVLRATNKDGDAITIRESLYLKVPIVASDIVQRPEGTIIFKNRNLEDLYNKIVFALQRNVGITYAKENYFDIYHDIYSK